MIEKTSAVLITFFGSLYTVLCVLEGGRGGWCCISLGVSQLSLSLAPRFYLPEDPTVRDSLNLPPYPKLPADEWHVVQLMNRDSD